MKIKKEYFIGAAIALVAMVSIFFLPIVNLGGKGIALFESFVEIPVFALTWIVFPVLCIVANLLGKLRGLAAWLMLIPFLWGLVYYIVPECSAGIGVWIYGVLTAVLIIYTRKTKEA